MGKQRYWLDYLRAVREHWKAAVFGGVGGVLGLLESQVTWTTTETVHNQEPRVIERDLVPTWVWLGLVLGGLVVAQFRAWRDLVTANESDGTRVSDLAPELQRRERGSRTSPSFGATEEYNRDALDQLLAVWPATWDEINFQTLEAMLHRVDRVRVNPVYEPLTPLGVLQLALRLAVEGDPRMRLDIGEDGQRKHLYVRRDE